MRVFSCLLLFATLVAGCGTSFQADKAQPLAATPALTLSVIHINDTHSQFDASPASVNDAAGQPLYTYVGGHPRVLTKAEQLRQQAADNNTPALFLHGGDAFKGSAYFELFEQRINIDILNRMNLDAMALGNHEFDIGLAKLANFVDNVNFPVLAANVDTQTEPQLANSANLKPYTLFAVQNNQIIPVSDVEQAQGREIIAVFGLALEDMRAISPDTGAVVFHNEVLSAQRTVDKLSEQGVKYIIALTHLGHQRDKALASAVNGIDAIVGGHSHSLLGDFSHWNLGKQRPYAELVTNPDGTGKTCVVQAGQFAQAVGQATLQFNNAGQLLQCSGQNTLLAGRDYYRSALRDEPNRIGTVEQTATEQYIASLPRTAITDEHAQLRAVLNDTYLPAVQKAYGKAISVTERTLNHVRLPGSGGSDKHGSEIAGYIADSMVAWLNQPNVQALTNKQVDFALIGAGNIRAAIEAGIIYEGHIKLELLPFNTPLSVLTITGKQLQQLLSQTIGATLKAGAHAGKFPYSGYLRYTAEETTAGQVEFTQLQLKQQGQWHNINPAQNYTLATTSYLADGNDGWHLLQQIQNETTDRVDIILQQNKPVLYPVVKVKANKDDSGAVSYKAQYQQVEALPCKTEGVNCKVAAQAMIDYLQANPQLWQQQREPTVTLQR